MKQLLIIVLFTIIGGIYAFHTCPSDSCEDSCKNRCGYKFDRSYSCQCNLACERFEDCCKDYHLCLYANPSSNEVIHPVDESENSCEGKCGKKYKKKDPCHCNKKCSKYNNCCPDYDTLCGSSDKTTSTNKNDATSSSFKTNKENSCEGKCGKKYKKKDPCHCNKKCSKYNNCCPDYDTLCGSSDKTTSTNKNDATSSSFKTNKGKLITPEEIKAMSEKIYKLDENRAKDSDIVLNKQNMAKNTRNKEDLSNEPLYTYVNQDLFNGPTYKAFIDLTNNYVRKTGTDESYTAEEIKEQEHFLKEIMKTKLMKELFTFLHDKGLYETKKELTDDLKNMWFGLYSRSSGEADSSGFEHVFIGEVKNNKVSGFHNWIHFYMLEKEGLMDYYSYNSDGPWNNYPDVLGQQFNWNGFYKEVGSQFIGSSPEFDFALYTLCFIAQPGRKCIISLGGHELGIQTYEWTKNTYGNGKKYIATAYAVV